MNIIAKSIILTFLCLILIDNQEAQAYINPGSGSYIFQTVIGGILSIFYLFKKLFLSIIGIFKSKGSKEDE